MPNQPCVIVFGDRHDLTFVDSILAQYPNLHGYIVHEDASVASRRGPHVSKVTDLRADHVVWVGVPSRWAAQQAGTANLFKSHFVGTRTRFTAVKDSVLVSRTVDAALEAASTAAARIAQQKAEQSAAAAQEHRRRRMGEPAPFYIPKSLR